MVVDSDGGGSLAHFSSSASMLAWPCLRTRGAAAPALTSGCRAPRPPRAVLVLALHDDGRVEVPPALPRREERRRESSEEEEEEERESEEDEAGAEKEAKKLSAW